MTKAPTLDDVAKQAGVSAATVSLVVNRRPGPRRETAQAIRQVIDELGYVAPSAGRPRGRRDRSARATNRVALLVGGVAQSRMNAPVYMDVLRGVEAGARLHGKTLLMNHLDQSGAGASALLPQRVDGVVLFGVDANDASLQKQLRGVPCVRIMGSIELGPAGGWDHVSYDNAQLGQVAADYLRASGCRRAVFISGSEQGFMLERGRVFREAMARAHGQAIERVDPGLLELDGSAQRVKLERMRSIIEEVLSLPEPPEAVFLAADTLAPGFYSALRQCGGRGESLTVISCNNEQMLLSHLHPRPATIDIHAERVGQRALDQLIWRIAHPDEPRVTLALQPTLVLGDP